MFTTMKKNAGKFVAFAGILSVALTGGAAVAGDSAGATHVVIPGSQGAGYTVVATTDAFAPAARGHVIMQKTPAASTSYMLYSGNQSAELLDAINRDEPVRFSSQQKRDVTPYLLYGADDSGELLDRINRDEARSG